MSHLEDDVRAGTSEDDRIAHLVATRDALLVDAAERARRYVAAAASRRVGADAAAVDALAGFRRPLPEGPSDPADVLAQLDDLGSPATVVSTGPRYFGFVTGGVHPAALAASWLVDAWDQNAALAAMSPVANVLNDVALRWIVEALDLPDGTHGAFTTGATMANATALAAARDHVLSQSGWDAHRDGLVGAPPIEVVVGGEAHATINKALGFIGLGRGRATVLPSDEQGRIIPDYLPELNGPAIVVLQAGNVNSGASDPFPELIAWAQANHAWVHVDGAFGLWSRASGKRAGLTAGVELADSWATDAHKWLNVTYDAAVVLLRDPSLLGATARTDAPYLVATDVPEPMHRSAESSQRARGAEAWAVLSSLGRSGLADLIDHTCDLAVDLADRLRAAGFEILNEVAINQVVVDLGPDTAAVIAQVQADGTTWAGPTVWRGRPAMRLSVSCWATTSDDIERTATAIIAAAGDVATMQGGV